MTSAPVVCDVLVVGDEVESILTAVSAARAGASVILARRSQKRLGGLSVRGGLSYMDITPEFVTGLFAELLQRTALIRVALNPERAHAVLTEMLSEANIPLYSGVETHVELDSLGFPSLALLKPVGPLDWLDNSDEPNNEATDSAKTIYLAPKLVIDATPDADIARALGVPYLMGLGGILGDSQDFLGLSPVFRIAGVSVPVLQAFEASLRAKPSVENILSQALPYHAPELRAEYITRPTYAPNNMDYLDILNPLIGIDYHIWRHGTPSTYTDADIFIDGGNIARLADGTLSFNGLIAQACALDLDFDDLLVMSHGAPIPERLQDEMRHVERYLRERAGFPDATLIPPDEMYVRQTVTLLSRQNMTARMALQGGVSPEKAIGTFSYWLDLRGTQIWKLFPGEHFPKPVFNVGLDVALPPSQSLQNIAFVGRSAGYSPIGQGTGRIVQHNSMLGEGLGVAAALSVLTKMPLCEFVDSNMAQVQGILKERRQDTWNLQGTQVLPDDKILESLLLKRDEEAVERLREAATDFLVL
jgi:hypothetical protein